MPSLLPTKPTAKALLRCVIVEDQVMFEQLFRLTLESVGGVDVVAVAHTAKKGIAACRAHLPDLLLLDLALPDKSGLVVAEALAKYRPEARTIIVSGEADTFQCPKKLRPFIYSVVDKTRALAVVVREIEGLRESLGPAQNRPHEKPAKALTPREIEILELIGEGLTNKEIAAKGLHLRANRAHPPQAHRRQARGERCGARAARCNPQPLDQAGFGRQIGFP